LHFCKSLYTGDIGYNEQKNLQTARNKCRNFTYNEQVTATEMDRFEINSLKGTGNL
jgi:hypothetical protein